MSAFLFLMLLVLAQRQGGGGGGDPSSQPVAAAAAHAQVDATVKQTQAAADPGNMAKRNAANVAQKKADDLTKTAQKQSVAKTIPPPWPQAMPTGLPAWPGGWEYDNPPPQSVQNRAMQLLPVLWKTGPNTRKTEQTQGRWITYQSEPVAGGKKGVVAYRARAGASPSASSAPSGPITLVTTAPGGGGGGVLPTIRQGSRGDAVKRWQGIIGVPADGIFGPATAAATKTWQQGHGLNPDGVVGPATWGKANAVTL